MQMKTTIATLIPAEFVSKWLWPTATSAVAVLVFYYLKFIRPKHNLLAKIPVQFPAVPILGASYYMEKSGCEFRKQLYDFCYRNEEHRKAGICLLWMGPHPAVLIWKAKYFEALLSSQEFKKSYLYTFLKPWLGEGLLTSNGEKWHNHRKLLMPSFQLRILNDYIPIMNEHSENLAQALGKLAGKNEVDIFPMIIMATLNVVCEAAMGQSTCEEDRKAREDVFSAVIKLSHIVHVRQKNPQMWPDLLFALTRLGSQAKRHLNTIHGYTEKIFRERIATFDRRAAESLMTTDDIGTGQKRNPLPFLDSLLYSCDNFSKMSHQEIKDQVNTFLFTGYDTTAATTTFSLYLLARHPEAQMKVQAELEEIFGSSNRPVNSDDLRRMKYLTACLKETLRLFPVAAIYARELMNDMQFEEYTVPAGSTVMLLTEFLHRDPDVFEDPLVFRPERFLSSSGDGAKINPFAYAPFSGGQRNCIGQNYAQLENKIMISSVLRRFWLECDYSEDELSIAVELHLRPTKGLLIRASYR